MGNEDNNKKNEQRDKKLFEWVKKVKAKIPEPVKKVILYIWNKLKKTLFFAALKACLLVFGLLLLIFFFKPRQAHISANISELDDYETRFTAGSVYIESHDCEEIFLFSEEALRISLARCEIEENSSSSYIPYWLAIYPEGSDEDKYCSFSISGQVYQSRFYHVSSESLYEYNVDRSEFSFVGPQNLKILDGRAVIETSDGETIAELDDDFLTIVKRTKWGEISPNEKLPVFSPDSGDLSYPVDSYKAIIESCSPIDYKKYNKNPENVRGLINVKMSYNTGRIVVGDVRHFESIITGEIALSYTPTPQEYRLNKQEFELINRTKPYSDLVFEYEEEIDDEFYKSEGTLNGYVSDGKVSKMPLFPSFKTWFYSNANMTPTAIITIVLTAIALFIKKDDETKKS